MLTELMVTVGCEPGSKECGECGRMYGRSGLDGWHCDYAGEEAPVVNGRRTEACLAAEAAAKALRARQIGTRTDTVFRRLFDWYNSAQETFGVRAIPEEDAVREVYELLYDLQHSLAADGVALGTQAATPTEGA